jgi:two-component system, NarL family, response regulator NreC
VSPPTATTTTMDIEETPQSPEPALPPAAAASAHASTNPIRLLLVDDKLVMREGVRALLDREPGLSVVAQASSVAEAVALDVRPDVVITDALLPDARGNDVVVRLRRRFAQAGIFVLIDRDQLRPDDIVGAATPGGGVRGYALKTATAAEFLSGLRTVAQGVQYVQPVLRTDTEGGSARTNAPVPRPPVPAAPSPRTDERVGQAAFEALTEKEREVLDLLVLGHTNAEIAAISKVSLRTVEARRARVLQKLGVRTRADLVRVARHLF